MVWSIKHERAKHLRFTIFDGTKHLFKIWKLHHWFFFRHSAVFYLECDCGQTEFTPPGILSLVKITNPILGPSFTHSVDLEKYVFSAGIYLYKFKNRITRTMYEICTKWTIKTPERSQWRRSGVFIVDFEQILHIVLVFPLLISSK